MAEDGTGSWTQSPAATAFSVLYGRALNYVLMPSDADVVAIAKEGINEAILRLNTRNWGWARFSADVSFTTSPDYALATSFKSARSLEIMNSAMAVKGTLDFIDPKNFELMYPDRSATGSPATYTIFNEFRNGKLVLNTSPTADFIATYPNLRLRYYRRMNTLSADTVTFDGPTEVEPYLVWYARASLAAHWAPEKSVFAERRALELWTLLVRDDVRKETTDF